ncbi:hypothetical protein ACM66B_006847 [Microbotryomycetes sp. NB124-2]
MAQPATAMAFQGLGLGDLGMPTNDSLPGAIAADTRYSAFRTTAGSSGDGALAAGAPGHAAEHAHGPDTSRVYNSHQAHHYISGSAASHYQASTSSRKHSTVSLSDNRNSISYPKPCAHHQDTDDMDFEPLMPAPAPPPLDPAVDNDHLSSRIPLSAQKSTKSRPSPIKVPSSSSQATSHLHALAPLLQKPFMQRLGSGKDKDASQAKSRTQRMGSLPEDVSSAWPEPRAGASREAKDVVEISAAKAKELQEAFEARVRKDSGYGGSISGPTPAVLPVLPPLSAPTSGLGSPNVSPRAKPTTLASTKVFTRPKASHQHHRRATSEDSPKVLQEATFRSFADVDLKSTAHDPATISFATREKLQTASPTLTSPTRAHHDLPARFRHSRSHSTTAISPRKNSLIAVDAFVKTASQTADVTPVQSPTRHHGLSASNSRRPSVAPKPFDSSNSVAISVRGQARTTREVARAPVSGAEPVTVLLQTHMRPEEVEASWTCTVVLDNQGKPCTQWALTLKPKAAWQEAAEPSTGPPAHFSGYSLGGAAADGHGTPVKSRSAVVPPETSPMSEVPPRAMSGAHAQHSPFAATTSRRPSAVAEHAPFDPHVDPFYAPGTPQRPPIESRDTIKANDQQRLLITNGTSGGHSPTRARRKLGSSDSSEDATDSQMTPRRPSASKSSSSASRRGNVTSPIRSNHRMYHDGSLAERDDDDEPPQTPTRPVRPPVVGVTPPTPFVGQGTDEAAIIAPPLPDRQRTPLNGVQEDSDNDTSSDMDVDETRRATELALARGKQRMMSKWSDTEGEETEEDDDRPKTSWSSVSDATTEEISPERKS